MPLVMKESEPLARHTVFRIGGPARFFVPAQSGEDIASAVRFAGERDLPWVMLGAGSNVLISDRGFAGMVIHPADGRIRVTGMEVVLDAGVAMARAVAESVRAGLSGFEWAIGVPGSIGGSVRGNAGCFGGEMKDVIKFVSVFNADKGVMEQWSNDECAFGYRESIFKARPELIVLSSVLALQPGDPQAGQRLVREHTARRAGTQDIGTQSAGCMFKNIPWGRRDIDREAFLGRFPEVGRSGTVAGISAGFLIDRAGLRGYRIGGAMISEQHGNFILNAGNATAEEVIMLIGLAKERVHRMFGVLLEEEIQYVGFEDFVAERKPKAAREAV